MLRTNYRRRLLRMMAALPLVMPPSLAAAQAALPAALVFAMPPAAVQQALLTAVGQLPPTHPRRRRYRLAVPFDTPLFPQDDMLREAPGRPYDMTLDTWLALPRN